jgi:hypothetical protein
MTLKGTGNVKLNCNSNNTITKLAEIAFLNHSWSKFKLNATSFQINFLVYLLGQHLVCHLFPIIATNIEQLTTSTNIKNYTSSCSFFPSFQFLFSGEFKIRKII